MRKLGNVWVLTLSLAAIASAGVLGANWDRFRGPEGRGVANDKNIPVQFGEGKNLLWKVKMPGLGNSSPIIWNGQIFLQTSSPDGKERLLLCLDAKTGKTVWEKKYPGQFAKTHAKNSLASATPATDGEMVYAPIWDGKDVILHAHTLKGEPVWHRNLGEFKSQHGAGASPVLYKDKLFFAFDMDGKAVLYTLDKKTGKILWETPRDAYRACYSAPQILEKPGKEPELIITSTTAITSYNPDSGSQNWSWNWTFQSKMPLRTIATSIEIDGMLFACSGDGGGDRQMVALNLPTADGAKPVQAWENRKEFPYVPCVLNQGKNIYFVNDKGFAGCFEAKTGKRLWFERQPEANFTASPVMIDGKMYACSEEGDCYVFDATPTYNLLARNKIGEMIRATPAVADGRLFIRGANHLYCFSQEAK